MKEMDIPRKRDSHIRKLYRRTQRISDIYAHKTDDDFDQILILTIGLCPHNLLIGLYRNNGARELIKNRYISESCDDWESILKKPDNLKLVM